MSDASLHEILAALGWLDDVLRHAVAAARAEREGSNHGGLFIADHDVDRLLASPLCASSLGALATLPDSNTPSRLARLVQAFDLTAFEQCILTLCLAPEIDRKYERIYAYLQDDVQATAPAAALALSLFCANVEEQAAARIAFHRAASLAHWILAPAAETSTLAYPLRLHPRVVAFLLGDDTLDDALCLPAPLARWVNPRADNEWVWSDEHQERMATLAAASEPLCILEGPRGSGRSSFAASVCRERNTAMLVCDAASLTEERVTSLFRELRIYDTALYLDGPVPPELARLVAYEAGRWPGLLFATEALETKRPRITIAFGTPDERMRRELWLRRIAEPKIAARLAALFRFLPGEIDAAAARAPSHSEADLIAACRQVSSDRTVSCAVKIPLRRGWDDLVLPKPHLEQLSELASHVRHQSRVYDDWGFHSRVSAGRGIVALFSGPPGTGKTLSAEVVARDLGFDLYRIDLASLISKYIGETEKNLARVFDEGERSGGIIFFDEADAVFGKRSEVKDAHDRYANIETSYLLQRIEDYPGLVILATNMGRNIDAAFQRRMTFVIDFQIPDASHRRRLWRTVFPPAAPLHDDVDFDFLSERFTLSGGHIRNIAVAAAFRAAGNGGSIDMQHVLLSLKREYQKMGKVCERAELGDYYHLVR
jgi:AAA+ superfamily predicted ATPase